MAKSDKNYKVKSKKPVFGKQTKKDGTKVKAGTRVEYADGRSEVLLTPAGKGAKYAKELKESKRYTNDGRVKIDGDGVVKGLSKEQRAYRAGYLAHSKDSARCHKAKNKLGGKSGK